MNEKTTGAAAPVVFHGRTLSAGERAEKVCPILRVRSRKTGKGRARKGSFLLYRAKFPAFCQFSTNIYLRIVDICTCKRDAPYAIIPIVHKGVVVPKTAARVGSLESSR